MNFEFARGPWAENRVARTRGPRTLILGRFGPEHNTQVEQ